MRESSKGKTVSACQIASPRTYLIHLFTLLLRIVTLLLRLPSDNAQGIYTGSSIQHLSHVRTCIIPGSNNCFRGYITKKTARSKQIPNTIIDNTCYVIVFRWACRKMLCWCSSIVRSSYSRSTPPLVGPVRITAHKTTGTRLKRIRYPPALNPTRQRRNNIAPTPHSKPNVRVIRN